MSANLNVVARLLLKLTSREDWPRAVAVAYKLGALNERAREAQRDPLLTRTILERFEQLVRGEQRLRKQLVAIVELRRRAGGKAWELD